MAHVICPTITAREPHEYREQIERVAAFAQRIHIDLSDGVFAPNKLIDISHVWWPAGTIADIHLMYTAVKPFLNQLIQLKPHMIILHAEAAGNFYDVFHPLNEAGIKVGVAVLPDTPIEKIKPAMHDIDHVLIFSGNLGYHGGVANLRLLDKARKLKKQNPSLEIGWDGGINTINIHQIAMDGVSVLNVGASIQGSDNPEHAYATLKKLINDKS